MPTLSVWAPTARTVSLQLFDSPTGSRARWRCAATTAPASGRCAARATWTGRYYRYQVQAWQPAAQQVVTASVTDPYSVALAADSTHSQLVDLTDPKLAPAGWARCASRPRCRRRAQI